jgi:hypothetical protein
MHYLLIVFYPKYGILPPTVNCCVDNSLWSKGWDATIGIKSRKNEDEVAREVSPFKIMQNCKFHLRLTSLFRKPLADNVFEGIGWSREVFCSRGACG